MGPRRPIFFRFIKKTDFSGFLENSVLAGSSSAGWEGGPVGETLGSDFYLTESFAARFATIFIYIYIFFY